MSNTAGAPARAPRRKNQRYGRLVKLTARISGRAPRTIYRVLKGEIVSAPVEMALYEAYLQIKATRRVSA